MALPLSGRWSNDSMIQFCHCLVADPMIPWSSSATVWLLIQWFHDPVLPLPVREKLRFIGVHITTFMHLLLEDAPHVSICVQSRFGDRCFAVAGSRIWNNLPANLRDKEVSCTEFRRQLKTFMFLCDFWLLHFINIFTYLHGSQLGLMLRTQVGRDKIGRLLLQQFHGVNNILRMTSHASLQGRASQVRWLS